MNPQQAVVTTTKGKITTNGDTVALRFPEIYAAFRSVALEVEGTWTGTLVLEGTASPDGDGAYVALSITPLNSATPATSLTAVGQWRADMSGLLRVRVRATATITGTANVFLTAVP